MAARDEMHKNSRGHWANGKGEILYTVTVEGNRFLAWAHTSIAAIHETIWEQWTRRSRKPPLPNECVARPADDNEAAELLRRRPSRNRPPSRSQMTLDGVPRDPRLDTLLATGPGVIPDALDRAHARRTDPATSHEAAASVDRIRTRQRAVYDLLRECGPLHDEALVALYLATADLPQQSVSGIRTRRSELVTLGLVEHRDYATTKGGRRTRTWGVVDHPTV